jgi:hypothetical protein
MATAFEVVDWVRLGGSLSHSEIRKSAAIVTRLHPPALKNLVECLDPDQKQVWDALNVVQDFPVLRHQSVHGSLLKTRADVVADCLSIGYSYILPHLI